MHELNPDISLAPDHVDFTDEDEAGPYSSQHHSSPIQTPLPHQYSHPNNSRTTSTTLSNGHNNFLSQRRESFPLGMLPPHLVPEEEARIEETRRREERERSNNYNPDNVRVRIVSCLPGSTYFVYNLPLPLLPFLLPWSHFCC